MKCSQLQKRLVDLLAGECTPSEETGIRGHLECCARCARELEDLKAVDSLLDALEPGQAPPGLLDQVMTAVEKLDPALSPRHNPGTPLLPARSPLAAVIRDLTAAAAVALVVLWAGTGWLAPLTSTAGNRVSDAVHSYVHYTGKALNRAQFSMSSINDGLFYGPPKNFSQGSDQK